MNKQNLYLAVVLALIAPTAVQAQNNQLPAVQNTYMSGSSSPSAARSTVYRPNQQGQNPQMQQQQSMPTGRQSVGGGLPPVKTSRYCGTPGEDMRNNTVRSAAIQSRMPKPVPQQQMQKTAPSGPTYSYSGGYDYKGK